MAPHHRRFAAAAGSPVLAMLCLVTSACVGGGDTDRSQGSTTETAMPSPSPSSQPSPSSSSQPSTSRSSASPPPARTLDELERRWADQRAAVVRRAVAEGWGVGGDGVLRGPGGLEVDLGDCPSDWNPRAGVYADSVRIAVVGGVNIGLGVFPFVAAADPDRIERINRDGGIGRRSIQQTYLEDGFQPAETVEAVASLLADDRHLSISTYGTGTSAAVAPTLAEACVPHLLPVTGPEGVAPGPWAVPFAVPDHETEATMWGQLLGRAAGSDDQPLRVAMVVMDNRFGWTLHDAFRRWSDANPAVVGSVRAVPHEPAAAVLDDVIEEVVAAEPDVVIAATAGNPCLLLAQDGSLGRLELRAAIIPSFCARPEAYLKPAGAAADGWLAIQVPAQSTIRPAPNPVWEQWVDRRLGDLGLAAEAEGYRVGMDYGWLQEQLLTLASELPGGLDRPNLLLAMWGADFEHPGYGPEVRWKLNGPADPAPIETAMVTRWDGAGQRWVHEDWVSVE